MLTILVIQCAAKRMWNTNIKFSGIQEGLLYSVAMHRNVLLVILHLNRCQNYMRCLAILILEAVFRMQIHCVRILARIQRFRLVPIRIQDFDD